MPSIPYSDEELAGLRNVSDVTRDNSMLRRLLATVDQAHQERNEVRGQLWQAWERHAQLDEEHKSLLERWFQDESDLAKVLCEGAFQLDRDPMDLQVVFYALQDGLITTGWARDAVRRWMAGLSIQAVMDTPHVDSPNARLAAAKEELAQVQARQLLLQQERDALVVQVQEANDAMSKLAEAVYNHLEAEGGPAHLQGCMAAELLAALPTKKGRIP